MLQILKDQCFYYIKFNNWKKMTNLLKKVRETGNLSRTSRPLSLYNYNTWNDNF